MKIEVIDWNDAVAASHWATEDGVKPHRIRSMGKVIEDTKTHVTLAGTVSLEPNDTSTNCRITIPTGMIHKRRTVKL